MKQPTAQYPESGRSPSSKQPKSQAPKSKLNPDDVAATLAFATHLQQQQMPQAPPQPQNAPTSAQQQQTQQNTTQPQKVDLKAHSNEMELMMIDKIDKLKKELTTTIKDEIGGIKDSIQEALTSEENGEPNKA